MSDFAGIVFLLGCFFVSLYGINGCVELERQATLNRAKTCFELTQDKNCFTELRTK